MAIFILTDELGKEQQSTSGGTHAGKPKSGHRKLEKKKRPEGRKTKETRALVEHCLVVRRTFQK